MLVYTRRSKNVLEITWSIHTQTIFRDKNKTIMTKIKKWYIKKSNLFMIKKV